MPAGTTPTVPPTLLLWGSSIMQAWGEPADLAPSRRLVNIAIGGTVTAEWLARLPSELAAHTPAEVLVYVGSNDVSVGVPAARIGDNLRRLRAALAARHPAARWAYLGIIKAPVRRALWARIDEANTAARSALLARDLWLESDPFFLRANGAPTPADYIEDGLHLTPAAYQALTAHVRPILAAWLTANPAHPRR